jgi:hypothetical protein
MFAGCNTSNGDEPWGYPPADYRLDFVFCRYAGHPLRSFFFVHVDRIKKTPFGTIGNQKGLETGGKEEILRKPFFFGVY